MILELILSGRSSIYNTREKSYVTCNLSVSTAVGNQGMGGVSYSVVVAAALSALASAQLLDFFHQFSIDISIFELLNDHFYFKLC